MGRRHPGVRLTFWLTGALDPFVVETACAELSPDEQRRQSRFRLERDRRDFAAAHSLLRCALSEDDCRPPSDWKFVRGPLGKPRLAPETAAGDLSFNLSHADGLVACAVARGVDLGVDVETIDSASDPLELARHYFAPAEIAELERCPRAERPARFIEIWTLKEAYVKATGDGLSCPLDEFSILREDSRLLRFTCRPTDDCGFWTFALFRPSDSHRLALAVRDPVDRDQNITVCHHDGPADCPLIAATGRIVQPDGARSPRFM